MSKTRDAHRVRTIFYPMAGGVDEQFNNLLQTLQWIQANTPNPRQVYEWLRLKFNLTHYFANNVYTVLLVSSGLVTVREGKCCLTSDGQIVLATASPVVLLEVFEKTFAGVAACLEVLRDSPHIRTETLTRLWFEIIKERFPNMKNWSQRTLNNQCVHRINWLRAMGFVETKKGLHTLSESGWRFVQNIPPESIAIQPHEIKEQEKQFEELTLGTFEPFDAADTTISLRRLFVRDRAFHKVVTMQYDFTCGVCDFQLKAPRGTYEAEAAHIVPKRRRGTDDPRNGICLCRTCHWLFDEGVISIHAQDLSVIVASYLERKANDESVRRVLAYRGRRIRSVKSPRYAPAMQALEWHNQHVFLG